MYVSLQHLNVNNVEFKCSKYFRTKNLKHLEEIHLLVKFNDTVLHANF